MSKKPPVKNLKVKAPEAEAPEPVAEESQPEPEAPPEPVTSTTQPDTPATAVIAPTIESVYQELESLRCIYRLGFLLCN